MPLGYVMTHQDVMDYYLERDDIRRALVAHGSRRRTVAGSDAGVFGRRGAPLADTAQIKEMLLPALEKQLTAIPRKYPAFHACITRLAAPARGGAAGPDEVFGRESRSGTDFVIDIDIKSDHKASFREGRKVLDLLDSYEVPYRIKFSGSSSPHIILPSDLFPSELAGESFHHVAQKLMEFVNRKSRATNIDGTFTSPDHYLRMPYSLNENTGLVSVPIEPGGYDSFRLDMAEAQNVVVRDGWMDVSNEPRTGIANFLSAAGVLGR